MCGNDRQLPVLWDEYPSERIWNVVHGLRMMHESVVDRFQ